jgi:type II secretory pathway component PulJ
MSTSEENRKREAFTLVEVLLALALSLLICLALSSVCLSLQRNQVAASDRLAGYLVGRVAASRLERDVRHATLQRCGNASTASLLRAEPLEIVLLSASRGAGAELIEWELAGRSLMRRHGPWTGVVPAPGRHDLYTSNKTILEGVSQGSFSYRVGGSCRIAVAPSELALIRAVMLRGRLEPRGDPLEASAEVGS